MVNDGDITSAEARTISNNLKNVLQHNYGETSYGIRLGKFHVDPKLKPELISMDGGRPYYRIWSDNNDDIVKDSTGNEF